CRQFPHPALADPDAARITTSPTAWRDLNAAGARDQVERDLFASLREPSDGYLARADRALSIALSRLFVRTALTPNAITALSLIVGLAGAALLARPSWGMALGAL